MDSTNSTTSKTPAAVFEQMVNEAGFQLEELEGSTNDVRSTIEDIVDSLREMDDPSVPDSEKVETADSLKWELQSLLDEINNIAGNAEEIGKYASELIDKFEKLFTVK